jgi:nucleotide sugar dehydrogenase
MDDKHPLSDLFKNKNAVIGIIGLGYVGLPLAIRYSEEGFKVVGFDIDKSKVDRLQHKQSYIAHISDASIAQLHNSGFESTTDFAKTASCDALIICVPTPLDRFRDPDISYIKNTLLQIKAHLRSGQIISLESTTYPGTTDEEIIPLIVEKGFIPGKDIFVVFSPEREDPGRKDFNTQTTPKVVGGHTQACLTAGIMLYNQIVHKVVPVSSTRAAEMTKLLENIHRAVNIGLVNEMKIVCDKMGLDVHEIIDAAATKPFGFVPYRPGPGLGGHCIPIDPFYLTWKAREFGVHTRFIELAGEINSHMPTYVIEKIILALNSHKKSVSGANILLLGVAYKKNVDDYRESPSLVLIDALEKLGATVQYHDPYIPAFKHQEHGIVIDAKSIELTSSALSSADCIVIATDHDQLDYLEIQKSAKLIVDCRGRIRSKHDNVVRA